MRSFLVLFSPFLEWLTDSLLQKIEKHPLLSKALSDPHLAQVMSQFQTDPQGAMQAAVGNPEVRQLIVDPHSGIPYCDYYMYVLL